MNETERDRIEQSNEVAGIVFDQVKLAWPDLHPVLEHPRVLTRCTYTRSLLVTGDKRFPIRGNHLPPSGRKEATMAPISFLQQAVADCSAQLDAAVTRGDKADAARLMAILRVLVAESVKA